MRFNLKNRENGKFVLKSKNYMIITFSRDFTSVAILNFKVR